MTQGAQTLRSLQFGDPRASKPYAHCSLEIRRRRNLTPTVAWRTHGAQNICLAGKQKKGCQAPPELFFGVVPPGSGQRAEGSGRSPAGKSKIKKPEKVFLFLPAPPDSGQRAAGSGKRAAGSGQRAAGSGQRAAGSGQRAKSPPWAPPGPGTLSPRTLGPGTPGPRTQSPGTLGPESMSPGTLGPHWDP